MTRLIKTSFVYPPIPIRTNDWCAWYDDEGEEAGRYGWGTTETEAIQDLRDNYPSCQFDGCIENATDEFSGTWYCEKHFEEVLGWYEKDD